MSTENKLDVIREETMDRIGRSERWFKGLMGAAALIEVAGLIALLLLMDFGDRTHVLILIAALLVYWVLGLWTWALAAHASMYAQRILKAIDLSREEVNQS